MFSLYSSPIITVLILCLMTPLVIYHDAPFAGPTHRPPPSSAVSGRLTQEPLPPEAAADRFLTVQNIGGEETKYFLLVANARNKHQIIPGINLLGHSWEIILRSSCGQVQNTAKE